MAFIFEGRVSDTEWNYLHELAECGRELVELQGINVEKS